MTEMVFTKNPWLYCQSGEHDLCATKVELTDRAELCPCLCHAPKQPTLEGGSAICKSHGLAVLMTHVNDGEPCSDYLHNNAKESQS